jgi:Cu-Zn family superoxide dismutase
MLQRKTVFFGSAVTLAALTAVGVAQGQQPQPPAATGEIINSEGQAIGSVNVSQLAAGLQIVAVAEDLPPGVHGFHIHETGQCEPPDFESAGGHFNPTDKPHGFTSDDGPHAGDLPNVHIGDDGTLTVEFVTDRVTLDEGDTAVLDDDGAALVIHADADDYMTDPAGNSGNRIACAVIQAAQQQQ